MATLPRMHSSKQTNVSFPFSTSPRKLQEMTLPTPEGHDVTTASGVSMKQYEEQLIGLRKENFHLKLRIYFLEEKLGTGAPPAVQGLLEHNVRLQVEVEELRRQLTDKQELLAAAAEAIDVLEQQGSISTDSVEASMDNCGVQRKDIADNAIEQTRDRNEQTCEDTCLESESVGDYLGNNTGIQDSDELARLRRENRKALQMIKGCMREIKQQDKEIKKINLDKELVYARVTDSHLEKYEEIVKCKDKHIRDLENKIKELQNHMDSQHNDATGNLQELLTKRLQGLAYFLDKLLSHKCVLGEDKKKIAESILEQSLALPVGLKLDESMVPEKLTMDESNLDISQSLRIEDLTMMFGHHMHCNDENRFGTRKPFKRDIQETDILSESECWSEPDKNVSQARIGLCEVVSGTKEEASDVARLRSRRSRISYGSRSEDNKGIPEAAVFEEISSLMKQVEQLEQDKKELTEKLEAAQEQIDELTTQKNTLNETLSSERANLIEANKTCAATQQALLLNDITVKEIEQKLTKASMLVEQLRSEKQAIEEAFIETEQSLRRAADEATVQASQAALERARAEHERLRAERELDDARDQLAAAMETNSRLNVEAAQRIVAAANARPVLAEAEQSEEDRPTSPDQGIDSDRLSSLEQNDALTLSPRSLYEENVTLKQKLARTKATLADTLAQLNADNMRKRSVQRAICREIHKTQGVLRKARDNFENQS